ncbi:MAG: methyltransferase domain-containing protein [Clostridiales bacterium]|nr:methyltransferase domain-containing protein [Clostridiales bacterium]
MYRGGQSCLFYAARCAGFPWCGGDSAWRCARRHSFDIAREGYVHLLPANQKHSKAPGDDKGMAAARNRFLSGDYYRPLRAALEALALEHTGDNVTLLDSGCGEGYYTCGVYHTLCQAGKAVDATGVDISKFSLRWAAKREKGIDFAVASAYRLPVESGSVNLLLNCFSPLAIEEFRRVMKPGGTFLYVVPGPEHLWELKQLLYDRPYRNEEQRIPYEGFCYDRVVRVEERIHLPDQEAIHDLFQMTPYYWKTPRAGAERLAECGTLDVQISFDIHVFHRTTL